MGNFKIVLKKLIMNFFFHFAAGEASDEGLSDMSDVEVCQYLLSAEESALKETVWTQMNQDYLDAQVIKHAHQAAAAQARRRPAPSASQQSRV